MTTTSQIRLDPLDLAQTFGCGQTFRWHPLPDGTWQGPLGDQLVSLRKRGDRVFVRAFPGDAHLKNAVERHLRAGDDISVIQRTLAERDETLANGMRKLRGLRIVKLDEWECLISFTLATYANIPRISKMIEALARSYGRRISDGVFAFPTLEQLKRASQSDLVRLGLGYRAKYIHSICSELSPDRLERLQRMSYPDLREELKALPGVGDKVADCVALFGFGKLESFPIDVWIERALGRLYRQRGSYSRLASFAHEKFGVYAGYAQEYLYYNERVHAPDGSCMFLEKA